MTVVTALAVLAVILAGVFLYALAMVAVGFKLRRNRRLRERLGEWPVP